MVEQKCHRSNAIKYSTEKPWSLILSGVQIITNKNQFFLYRLSFIVQSSIDLLKDCPFIPTSISSSNKQNCVHNLLFHLREELPLQYRVNVCLSGLSVECLALVSAIKGILYQCFFPTSFKRRLHRGFFIEFWNLLTN